MHPGHDRSRIDRLLNRSGGEKNWNGGSRPILPKVTEEAGFDRVR